MKKYLPLIGLLCFIVLVAALITRANAATVVWGCIPSLEDIYNKPLTGPVTYSARVIAVDGSILLNPEIKCTNPISVNVPDPPGKLFNTYVYASNAAGTSLPSAGLRIASTPEVIEPEPEPEPVPEPTPTPSPPTSSILTTVGGDVWLASPNWTTFKFKKTDLVGTIAADIKCDSTRFIAPDLYRVTGPIIWIGSKKDYVVAKCRLK